MNLKISKDRNKFLRRWVLFNGIAGLIGLIVTFVFGQFVVTIFYPGEKNVIIGLFPGLVVGYAQWLVLKKYLKISAWWIFVSAIGMGIPDAIAVILFELNGTETLVGMPFDLIFRLFIGGLITGILQFKMLKPVIQKYAFWIIVSALAWATILFGAPLGGVILGLITGIFLFRFIEFPNQEDLKKND